ncbi:MAG: fimbrial protein [Tannerellaceae bacterium]|nr:fimbrial protein [Tannerellaceae bacterium]
MKTNSLLINLYFIFHFSFFMSSCLIDKDEIYMETENAGKEIPLKVQVSGHSAPESRAFSATGENSIQTLDVFVFEEKPSGEQFVYYRPATHIEGNTGTNSIRAFSVSLQESEESGKVRFVLVANMRDRIENISFQKGEDKETVLKKSLSMRAMHGILLPPPVFTHVGRKQRFLPGHPVAFIYPYWNHLPVSLRSPVGYRSQYNRS